MNPRYNTMGRSQSQVAAPGARNRGMIQNAAITGALGPQGPMAIKPPAPPTGMDGRVIGQDPFVSRPETVIDTPPTPLGAPTPGERPSWDKQSPMSPLPQRQAPSASAVGGPPEPPPGSIGAPPAAIPPPTAPDGPPGGPTTWPQTMWQKGQVVGTARPGADFGRLGGGFGSADSDSIKHTFGRIAQNFEHTPAGLQQMMSDPEFRQYFPFASVSKDWIDFGGQMDPHTGTKVGKIDVMQAYDPEMGAGNNKSWQWLTEEEAMGGGGGQADAGLQPLQGGQSYAAQILAMIMAQNKQRGY